ncbi:MAG: hypothetical protein JF592_10635 [Microbacterium sp.]|uniref:hypothetical protein n=1 Tax=Microbacterium sp. TaxID=51671 RepID=UPI001DCE4A65|nr:hypothetical protein [Microbacterium sp.]MBW8763028.1 hypothetical protein [Microbacterium sp.]
MIIRFGRPTPWRSIIVGLIFGVGSTLVGSAFSLVGSHPENTPLMLIFLAIPAIATPLLIGFNQYAEFDQRTGLISINGATPVPLTHITWTRTMTNQWSFSSLELGTGRQRTERFMVANGPFGNPRVERDGVRHLLPYTGLPRRGVPHHDSPASPHDGPTLDEVMAFAHERLR